MARLKRSVNKEELWRLLVEEQRQCGLSIRAFCRRKAVSEPSFYAWRKKLQERDAENIAHAVSNHRLIPVDVIRPAYVGTMPGGDDVKTLLEICTPGGFTLRFDHDTTPETVARLLDVIALGAPGGTRCATPVLRSEGATSC